MHGALDSAMGSQVRIVEKRNHRPFDALMRCALFCLKTQHISYYGPCNKMMHTRQTNQFIWDVSSKMTVQWKVEQYVLAGMLGISSVPAVATASTALHLMQLKL